MRVMTERPPDMPHNPHTLKQAPAYTPKDVPELRRTILDGWRQRTRLGNDHPTMQLLGLILEDGENYYVSPDMVKTALAAESSWPAGGQIDLEQVTAIATQGFMLGGDSFYVVEVTDVKRTFVEDWHVRGFAWSVAGLDSDDGLHIAVYPLGSPADIEDAQPILGNEGEVMVHTINTADEPDPAFPYLVPIMWMLMDQPITRVRSEPVCRTEAKRCRRAGVPSTLNIVTLRRELMGPAPEGHKGPRDWSHRWMVSGHWANLAVGPGRTQHRMTWIPAYVKGPADKPLVIKDQVRAWVR